MPSENTTPNKHILRAKYRDSEMLMEAVHTVAICFLKD
jgi:hypothetical protein